MASIDKRPNGKWRARYRERPGGPQRARHFDRKSDAERFLARVQSQLLDGSYIDSTAGRQPFAGNAAAWQQSQVHRPTTVAQVDAHLRNHMLPAFGDRPVASIRPSEVQAWVRRVSEVLAPATVEVVYRIFAAILKAAVDDRLMARSPCTGVRLHDLRHFYTSLLIRHGESVKVVQARLGHASASETLDTYSHLWPDNEERTRAAVDEVLGIRYGERRSG